ncbi:hypothetical protein [Algirhabdus cladophorae]|uniref:hypothetical protein n=1 Tax=Algirhabdus cladophorae TaxID=3377108 RepID=UPI003B845314
MIILTTLTTAVQKWMEYRNTLAELRAMPLNVALDLDIYRGDAKKIAAKAVYG